MNGTEQLEAAAAAVVFLALLSFLVAWDSQGEAGEQYRDTVKKFGWFLLSPLPYLAGKAIGFGAWIACVKSERARRYRYLRTYKGGHHRCVSRLNWQN